MSTTSTTAPRATLVATWYDTSVVALRARSLALWRRPDGSSELVSSSRASSSDVWNPPAVVATGLDFAAAQAVASTLGLWARELADHELDQHEAEAAPAAPAPRVGDYVVRFAGRRRGWFVLQLRPFPGDADVPAQWVTAGGPYTSREQAFDALAELRATEPSVVVNMEAEPPQVVGTYLHVCEDTVVYRDDAGRVRHAPEDCVRVVVRELADELIRAEVGR